MNVVLVGLRGSGKTTVGRILASTLKRDFIDCDQVIEERTSLPVQEIFKLSGEPHFRRLESEVIEELSHTNHKVIATGGGAVLRYRNLAVLKRSGVVFFLDVDPNTALERISKDPESALHRPPLTGLDSREELKHLADRRRPYYLKAADHVVPTSGRVADQVAAEILGHLKDRPGFAEP